MRRSNKVLILILLVSNVLWAGFYFFTIVNLGVTQTHMGSNIDSLSHSLDQAIIITNAKVLGTNVDAAKTALSPDIYGYDAFVSERCLHVGGLCLIIDNNGIVTKLSKEQSN